MASFRGAPLSSVTWMDTASLGGGKHKPGGAGGREVTLAGAVQDEGIRAAGGGMSVVTRLAQGSCARLAVVLPSANVLGSAACWVEAVLG